MEIAKVTLLFKQGDRSDINNYRPISVISAIVKVFQRLIYNQLSSYLSENNILSQYQPGFRSCHSTMTALLEATDFWAFNIDRGYVNDVVFLDLKKAFDTVDHPILLSKLLPTRQPSEDARLAKQQHYRAVRRREKARVFVR